MQTGLRLNKSPSRRVHWTFKLRTRYGRPVPVKEGFSMLRFRALALAALVAPTLLSAQAQPTGLAQAQAHLRAVQTMTASFTQTDRRGRSLSGALTVKRPGRIRFDYGRSANMLIVGDGRALTFLDYEFGQTQRWPINDSPLSVLLNPDQDLARFSRVVQNDAQVLLIEARDPRRREFGTITLGFARVAGAPAGLVLQGWNTRDAQNNVTTVRLSNQRFNVPVADSAFTYRRPERRGPHR
jgi:outer membrane lipoprotein-sorting protein